VGNRFLTTLSNMFTNLNLTDMETCYKVFRREVIQSVAVEEDRFGFEPEVTAKVASAGWRVYEVGISYNGRTYAEGKKIGWRDGVRAVVCILKFSVTGERLRTLAGAGPAAPPRPRGDDDTAAGQATSVSGTDAGAVPVPAPAPAPGDGDGAASNGAAASRAGRTA
jgi:hypothetical protein